MKIQYYIILFIFFVLLLSSCDFDKYFGYSNETEDLLQYVEIRGKVTNFYTDEPAPIVRVSVRHYETLTDYAGHFYFTYILTADDERNRPLLFRFTQEKYYPEEKSVVINPLGTEVNVSMRYAAPIIKKAALFPGQNSGYLEGNVYTCQAIVMDYQGINTVTKVEATIQIEDGSGNVWDKSSLMIKVDSPDLNEGYFQTKFQIVVGTNIKNGYRIYAQDNEGFDETLRTSINPNNPDDPIF